MNEDYYLEHMGYGIYKAIKTVRNTFVKISSDVAMKRICMGQDVYCRKNYGDYRLMRGTYQITDIAEMFCNNEWFAAI